MKKFLIVILLVLGIFLASCDMNLNADQKQEPQNNDEPTKEELIIEQIDKLSIPKETKTNLELKDYYIFENTFINVKWESSNPDVINVRGGITRGTEDVSVTLTANFSSTKGFSYQKTYKVIVLGLSDYDRLTEALDEIEIDGYLFSDYKLPTSVSDSEISLSWTSNHPEIIDETGVKELPVEATVVTLTVVVRLYEMSIEKEFIVIAYKQKEVTAMNTFNVLNKYRDFEAGTLENLAFDSNDCLVMTGLEGEYTSPIFNTSDFTELTASWSAITNSATGSVEVQVRLKIDGTWCAYMSYGAWKMSSQNASCSGTTSDGLCKINQDEVTPTAGRKATAYQYKVIFRRSEGESTPVLKCVNVALKINKGDVALEDGIKQSVVYDVPKLYQREVPNIGGSICSPTTTAMMLKYYGYSFAGLGYQYEQEYVARIAYDHGAQVFGNWSFNVAFMGSMGEFAYVRRFAGANDLINYLSSHGPVGLSVKGNMQGLYTTAGHLLVCKGYRVEDGKYIFICNDPNVVGVEVEYTYETIQNVWRNIAYVIEPELNVK